MGNSNCKNDCIQESEDIKDHHRNNDFFLTKMESTNLYHKMNLKMASKTYNSLIYDPRQKCMAKGKKVANN